MPTTTNNPNDISNILNLKNLLPIALTTAGGVLSNTTGARTSTTSPTISPGYSTLADLLRSNAEARLRSSMDVGGYAANGIADINDAFKGITQSADNNLTARGLATSPVAATVGTNLDIARGGNIARFLNNLPFVQQQLQTNDINTGLNVLRTGGLGSLTVNPGSAVGSGFSSAAEMLAFLAGQGLLGGTASNAVPNSVPNLPGSIFTGDVGFPTGTVPLGLPLPTTVPIYSLRI